MHRNNKAHTRIMMDFFLFFGVLYAPWWFVFAIGFLCILYYKRFYEAFFLGMLFDALYGVPTASLYGFRFVFGTAFLLSVFSIEYMKEKVRV